MSVAVGLLALVCLHAVSLPSQGSKPSTNGSTGTGYW
jgi:hypothetical protein